MVQYKIRRRRQSRVSEAVAEYKAASGYQPVLHQSLEVPGVYHVTVTDRGRIVLPAEIRERLKIRDGDRIAVILEHDGTASLVTQKVALDKLQGMFKHLAPKDHFASDDIIAERRRDAQMDDHRNQEWLARQRRNKKR